MDRAGISLTTLTTRSPYGDKDPVPKKGARLETETSHSDEGEDYDNDYVNDDDNVYANDDDDANDYANDDDDDDNVYANDDDDDKQPWVTLEPHTLSRTFPPGSREPPIIGGKLV